MERAKALFQMKTNLRDALSGGIHFVHYNVMQTSKNRNKTGYLRHCPTHTHLRLHETHTRWWWYMVWQLVVIVVSLFHLLTESHNALCKQRRLLPGELLLWSPGGQPLEERELPSILAEPGHWNETTVQVGRCHCKFCFILHFTTFICNYKFTIYLCTFCIMLNKRAEQVYVACDL